MITKSLWLVLPLVFGAIAQAQAACDASLVQGFVGKKADEAAVKEATETAKATATQVITPTSVMNKMFVQDRLNITTDKDNTITSISCEKGGLKLQ